MVAPVVQNVANSPTNSYPVAVFKLANGAELQAVVVVDISGNPYTSFALATTSAGTNATPTTASSVILASNPLRKGGWVKNIGLVPCYVSFSSTAATTGPTLLNPGDTLNLNYSGDVSAITAVGTTTLEVVELT